MDTGPLDLTLIAQARTVIARLELVSHGRTANLGPTNSDSAPAFPPGGIAGRDDREPDQPHKSHLHYNKQFLRCETNGDLLELIEDAQETLHDWQHSRRAPRDSRAWKALVAADTRRPGDIAEDYGISRQYVWQIKKMYGQQEAA